MNHSTDSQNAIDSFIFLEPNTVHAPRRRPREDDLVQFLLEGDTNRSSTNTPAFDIVEQLTSKPSSSKLLYKTRGGEYREFSTEVSDFEPFGFYPNQRVNTSRGLAWVIGLLGNDLYWHIDGDNGASKWTGFKKSDYQRRNFQVVYNPPSLEVEPEVVSDRTTTRLGREWTKGLLNMVNNPHFADVIFHIPSNYSCQSSPNTDDQQNIKVNRPYDSIVATPKHYGSNGGCDNDDIYSPSVMYRTPVKSNKTGHSPTKERSHKRTTNDLRFYAHRAILSATSEYFANMFRGSTLDSSVKDITLHNISYDTLNLICRYLYTNTLSEDEVRQGGHALVDAADMFLLSELKELCGNLLMKTVDETNVLTTLSVADKYKLVLLKEYCLEFTLEQMDAVVLRKQIIAFLDQGGNNSLVCDLMIEARGGRKKQKVGSRSTTPSVPNTSTTVLMSQSYSQNSTMFGSQNR